MRLLQLIVAHFAAVLMLVAATATVGAQESRQASPGSAAAADELQGLNERYAKTSLRLAQLNLQRAIDANRKIARAVSSTEVERLRQIVNLAEDEVRKEMAAGKEQGASMNVRTASANAKVAIAEWRKAQTANEREPGTVTADEMERLRLTAELAQLGLARERAAGNTQSVVGELEWQIAQLRQEVQDLRAMVERLAKRK